MKITAFTLVMFNIAMLITGCKERFDPPLTSEETNFLVVDGVFNTAGNSTFLLSRTTNLKSLAVKPELKASVTVESSTGTSYRFSETGNGAYQLVQVAADATANYRLKIRLANGEEYLSDFVPANSNPPIDSVGWSLENNGGVLIYVNTHNPLNNTRYYRWETEETWQIFANLYANIKVAQTSTPTGIRYVVQDIDFKNYPYSNVCWRTEKSKAILLASTTQLSQDIIYQSPLTFIPKDSEKFAEKYSTLVRQYALSKEAFEYWRNMKKNSEELGTIFSPQPSETAGNIHSATNAKEPVIGYFEACDITEKRIFIKNSDFFNWNYSPSCTILKIPSDANSVRSIYGSFLALNWVDQVKKDSIYSAVPACVDCSVNGSPVKPAFWK